MTPHARILRDVADEWGNATEKFEPFHSAHEGWAVIREELDELWEGIKDCYDSRPGKLPSLEIERLRSEAIQVAAMACRFIEDICDRTGHG